MKGGIKMEFANTRIHISNTQESEVVQKALFKLGYTWNGSQVVQNTEKPYLYVNSSGHLGHGTSRSYFEDSSSKKVNVDEILKKKLIYKAPTHIVIWDEEGRDPHKFFTSKPETDDFIKELIEKRGVRKDSIVLVEIKTVKKIEVVKNLRSKEYKI